MLNLATKYFSTLFISVGVEGPQFILDGVESCISGSLNEKLDQPFTYEEVCFALKSMLPLKASGEDGLGAIFYQRFWHIIGHEVADFCIKSLRGMHSLSKINQTRIILVPKVSDPTLMSQFCTINLCNILYNIISKMLVNRFQKVLHLCIEEA